MDWQEEQEKKDLLCTAFIVLLVGIKFFVLPGFVPIESIQKWFIATMHNMNFVYVYVCVCFPLEIYVN